jgi:2-polyprenyl-3-methyl-5-hydroxy-6-metoxy-1,4-benzoquinol methylase
MRNLANKFIRNLKDKGLSPTVKAVFVYLKNNKGRQKKLLAKYVKQHNEAYGKISKLAMALNGGTHPKRKILNYDQYFWDNIEAGDKILDIGSGNGITANFLANKASKVAGIDLSEKNIEQAKNNFPKDSPAGELEFIVADATKYNFNDKFDKIILSNVLEHIAGRVEFLKKLKNIAPIILLRVPMLSRDWLAVYKKNNGFDYKLDKTHFIEYTLEELKNELNQADWEIKDYQINWGEFWGIIQIKE